MASIAGVNIDLTSNVLTSKERDARKNGIKLGGLIYSAAYDADLPDTGAVVAAAQVKDFRLGVDQQTFNKFVIENVATKVASPSASGGVKLATKLTDEQELSYAGEGIAFLKLTTGAGLTAPNILTSDTTDVVSLTTNSTEGVNVAYIDLPGLDNTKGISLTTDKKIGLKIDTNFFAFEAVGSELGTKSPYYPSNTRGNLKLSNSAVIAPLKLNDTSSKKGISLEHDGSLKVIDSGDTNNIGKLSVAVAEDTTSQFIVKDDSGAIAAYILEGGGIKLTTKDTENKKPPMLYVDFGPINSRLTALEALIKNAVFTGTADTSTATN